MFTIIDIKHKNVIHTGLTLEQRPTKLTTDSRFCINC